MSLVQYATQRYYGRTKNVRPLPAIGYDRFAELIEIQIGQHYIGYLPK